MIKHLLVALIVLTGTLQFGYAGELPDPYCNLAGRDFSLAEIRKIVSEVTAAELPQLLEKKLPEMAAVVICSRSGVELSQQKTLRSLQAQLLLLSQTQAQEFDSALAENGLTREKWLERESQRFDNQINEALQRWFKRVAGTDVVSEEHVKSYYYRNMNKFRRVKLDSTRLLVFAVGDQTALQKAVAALQQGMLTGSVRSKYALNVKTEDWFDDLQKNLLLKKHFQDKYLIIKGDKYWYLLENGAFTRTYLPLDGAMKEAIAVTLYDAYAKAYLSEKIKRDFSGIKLHFY